MVNISRMDRSPPGGSLEQRLRQCGGALTSQRRAILSFLEGNLDHPSAAEVFDAVQDQVQASRATVYNTLASLEHLGLLSCLRGADGTLRYDPNVTPHHHLCCTSCGRLEDVPLESVTLLRHGRPVQGTVRLEARCSRCEGEASCPS